MCFPLGFCSIDSLIDEDTNQPQLIAVIDEDLPTNYSIAVEQVVHVTTDTLLKGIFLTFAIHYIYDIAYNQKLRDFYLFFETISFSSSEECLSLKPSAVFTNFMSSLECYLK